MEAVRAVFLESEVLINYGRDHGDAELQGEGEAYAANALRTDLATVHSLHSLFRPKGCFWVVEDPETGTAVGSVALEDKGDGLGELRRMCINPTYRRRGLARALVCHLQAHAVGHGFTRVFLTTPSVNAPALALYKSLGFVELRSFVLPGTRRVILSELEWLPTV